MDPDDTSAAPNLSLSGATEPSDLPAPDLASATAAGAREEEPPGASTPAAEGVDPDDEPPAGQTMADDTTAPLEADEARLLGGVTPDAIAAESDAPDAEAGTQADARGADSSNQPQPPAAGRSEPARLGTDAPASPRPEGSAPDASSSLPTSGQLVTAAGNSMVKRAVPLVSVAAIVALILRSLRRRSH